MKRIQFLMFPIVLLKNVYSNKDIRTLITYSVMYFGQRIKHNPKTIVKVLVNGYFKDDDNIPDNVKRIIRKKVELSPLNSSDSLADLADYLESYSYVYEDCLPYFQWKTSLNLLGINSGKLHEDLKIFNHCNDFLSAQEEKYGKNAFCTVHRDLCLDTYKGNLSLNHFRMIAALSSIIGKRNFNKTYRKPVTYRMFGAKNEIGTNDFSEDLHHSFCKINRYQFDKLIQVLDEKKLISRIPDTRGFFVSIKYDKDELFEAVKARIIMRRNNLKKNINYLNGIKEARTL